MIKRVLKNDFLQLEYLTTSLRITGLSIAGKPNLLADVSDQPPVPTPYGDYHFIGGHRLWHAPEAMPRSYIPDDDISITELPNGVLLESKAEPGTGIRKRIEIRLAADKPSITLIHTLVNDGLWPIELAPWAITQLRLGGTVILPMPIGNTDPAGLLHNRQICLWPYTRINDPRIKWDDKFVLFKANALPPFKMGYFNPHGWLAYWLDGVLFRKTFEAYVALPYPDNNCNAEMYCNERFVELESLAPLLPLNPGDSTSHTEKWNLFTGLDSLPEEVRQVIISS
ncbi:hypothetical protein ANAEL_04880 [Anaerolineales bacterium]|nr:hypothetical protein ANAEL_04880 [Anaerolineales bacterium]